MKKIIVIIMLLVFMSGCSNGKFNDSYKKMDASRDEIKGYNMDIRVYGFIGEERVNETIRVINYENKEYKIITSKTTSVKEEKEEEIIIGNNTTESEIYIKDSKTYIKGNQDVYEEVENGIYSKTYLILDSIKEVKKVITKKEEKIGEDTYEVSEVKLKKEIIQDIVKDMGINAEVKEDVDASIYIDKDKSVYRIIYNIEDITINVTYFGINKVNPITYPAGIN